MPGALILLNGPPASGKSTLADRLVEMRPLALNLDLDVIRGQLGRWLDQPTEAGLAARALAISMIDTHLHADNDVVVPQFLARSDFIQQLEISATDADAEFVEISLEVTRSEAVKAFEHRRQSSTRSIHQDAAKLVDRSPSADPIGELYDALQLLLETRSRCHRITVDRGDIDATLAKVCGTLSERGINW
jgi:predicted kinase